MMMTLIERFRVIRFVPDIALIKNNASVGAQIAVELSKIMASIDGSSTLTRTYNENAPVNE